MKHVATGIFLLLGSLGKAEASPPNVLLFILDDYGAVSAESYQDIFRTNRTAPTPHITGICQKGIRFTKVWSNPTCSPTRANLLTGRYSFRTGVGRPCSLGQNEIGADEPTLPRLIEKSGQSYKLANVGKWHLGQSNDKGGRLAPNFMGWDYFSGVLSGGLPNYYSWPNTINGETVYTSTYATTKNIDDVLGYLGKNGGNQPYFAWIAFNAPHTPLHLPPGNLHSYQLLSGTNRDIRNNPVPYYESMVEATDTEIGRLLDSLPDQNRDGLPDNTLVIVMGDNGTQNSAVRTLMPAPFERASGKGTLYEHGVRVPLCIAGDGVVSPGRDVESPVNITDLYQTILEYTKSTSFRPDSEFAFDSVSLVPYLKNSEAKPQRPWVFTEQFNADSNGSASGGILPSGAAIGDLQHRFIRYDDEREECFDIIVDPLETSNLLNSGTHEAKLKCSKLRATMLDLVCSDSKSAWSEWCE
ncbi:sulfatase-like hydrolase/transferase [Pseudobacteriovorax antillogorgiicola]|uniref:Arylsulfatase A n=1 Tax=Pseudobacteriovorax antillogorgiicola TaxID=1513793 RepID=A0A1Y6B6P7_9BACT|nr:sulfatase-like hydrolase/transferase [Pseudobacteriovorax antillogorgiicola]TCS58770.1 arylsulfatase A-like enzyme [Pseudobacteriovorax antillogorgiicola]SME94924.1 Arylsulfatase A [Pseudobacteriovorax antillogorgiicola]